MYRDTLTCTYMSHIRTAVHCVVTFALPDLSKLVNNMYMFATGLGIKAVNML